MRVAALLGGFHRLGDQLNSRLDRGAVLDALQPDAIRPQRDDLAILHPHYPPGERQDRRQV